MATVSAQGRRTDDAGRDSGAQPAVHELRLVPSPPLAPDLPSRVFRPLPALAAVGTILLAGIAWLAGSSAIIVGVLACLGCMGLVALVLVMAVETRARSIAAEISCHSRAQTEELAGRVSELMENERRFHGLLDVLGDLVVHRDGQGTIIYANTIFADVLGMDQRDLVGQTLAQLGVDIGIAPDTAFAEGDFLSSMDVAIRSSSGTRWFAWVEFSMRDSITGHAVHRAIASDITSRKRAENALMNARERAEYASQAKARFITTIGHQVRAPMNGLVGMAKLLADTELSPEQRIYVGAMSTSAGALLALVGDLLDNPEGEAGDFDMEPQPMSPREIADNIVELLAVRAFSRNIGIGCHVAPDVPQTITSDSGRIRQVLLNQLENAIGFTDSGGVLLSVTRVGEGEAMMIRFSVSDTGASPRAGEAARMFEEFEEADGDGPGRAQSDAEFGLALSKRLVAAMGGRTFIDGRPGKGTDFAFEIPATDAIQDPPIHGPALTGCRVVVISRNAVEAEAIAMTIRAHGGSVDIAATPAQAAPFGEDCSALFIDAVLEKPDGRVLKRLRKDGFAAAQAITLISPNDRGKLGEFRASGYSTFLTRPVRGETLLRTLVAVMASQPRAAQPVAGSPATESATTQSMSGPLSSLAILVAEDNDINAMLVKATLLKAGHRVDVVGNGKAAVEAVTGAGHKQRYDAVLMDLYMPVMDGLPAMAAIRRHEAEAGMPPVPIMALLTDGQEKTRQTALAHGASGLITKPLTPEVLVHMIEGAASP